MNSINYTTNENENVMEKVSNTKTPLTPNSNTNNKWYPDYWYWSEKQGKIILVFSKVVDFLRRQGFFRFDIGDEFVFIQVKENIAEECTITRIQDIFFQNFDKLPDKLHDVNGNEVDRKELREKIYKGLNTYFSKNLLARLGTLPNLQFLEADKNSAYFCFKDCIVKVTKEGIEAIEYKNIDRIIWKNSILDKAFSPLFFEDYRNCVFARFIRNVSKNKIKNGNDIINQHDAEREQAVKTIIGYNLHPFFETKLKATILTDTGVSENAEGRTGKTLITRAMGKMLNSHKESKTYTEIAGKNFDFSKSFRYELCELGTKLVHINDAKDRFQFELLYNDITEGITVEGKNKKSFIVSAKIILSSNRTIRLSGGSDRDRALEFQVSDHYSSEYSPADEFGHWFFRDWDKEEWNRFYNYMLHCVQEYFVYGLVQPKNIDLEERKLVAETKQEFVEYMDNKLKKFDYGQVCEYEKHSIFNDFVVTYPDFGIFLRQKTFTNWIHKWSKCRPKIKEIHERQSGKKRYIKFVFSDKKKG